MKKDIYWNVMKKGIQIDVIDRYYNIGYESSLKGRTLDTYFNFMTFRFPNGVDKGYAEGWARTFKEGKELKRADPDGRRVLRWLNPKYRK
jgi:hypothetical protein